MMFQSIEPDGPVVDPEMFESLILQAIDDTTDACLDDFDATAAGWDHKPEFYTVPAENDGDDAVGYAGTNDEIYGYVNDGTQAHGIDPVNAKILKFSPSKGVRTQPGVLGSGARSEGDDSVFAPHVEHPGITARGFDEAISEKRQVDLERNVMAAMLRGANS